MPDPGPPPFVWEQLAEHLGGEIIKTIECGSGFTPGVAFRLVAKRPDGDLAHRFVKAISREHEFSTTYRAEAESARSLPKADAVPCLRWDGEIGDWVVLIFDDAGSRTADLRPGSPDIAPAVTAVNSLHRLTAPAHLPTVGETLGPILHGWAELARDPTFHPEPWEAENFERLVGKERSWLQYAGGNTLLHSDIRADNLVTDEVGRVSVVDWAHACRGAPWIDSAELMSHLVLSGHCPAEAEAAIAGTALDHANRETVTSFIVASAGYWRRSSLLPPPQAPGLREFQAHAAGAATRIIRHRG